MYFYKNEAMKNIQHFRIILGLSISIAIITFFTQCGRTVDSELKKTAEYANKQLPRLTDEWTRLDSCAAIPGETYRFYHTMVQLTDSTALDTISFKKEFTPVIIDKIIKVDPSMKFFRENNVTLQYQYADASGNYRCRISISPDQYNKK